MTTTIFLGYIVLSYLLSVFIGYIINGIFSLIVYLR